MSKGRVKTRAREGDMAEATWHEIRALLASGMMTREEAVRLLARLLERMEEVA
jgi:hypothetical protein